MLFDTHMRGSLRVISFNRDVDARSNISELLLAFEEDIKAGITSFAIEFTPNSYLYSKTIAALVRCMNTVNDAGGRLTIAAPNKKLAEALRMFHLDTMLTIVSSLDEMQLE